MVIEDILQGQRLVEKQGESVNQCADGTFTMVPQNKLG